MPFSIKTPAGKTFEQPGNFFFLIETSLWGTEPKFAAKGVKPDLDGDGKVEFGEARAGRRLPRGRREGLRDQRQGPRRRRQASGSRRTQDAFTALVVMTPTMSEYFEAWKSSRFVAGAKSKETVFVAASRLQDIAGILGGLVLVYDSVEPVGRGGRRGAGQADRQRAQGAARSSPRKLRDEEAGGQEVHGPPRPTRSARDAQDRAEAIAGQVSQAAGQLGIKLES